MHDENVDSRHGIHFQVHKPPFKQLQVLDARLLTISPGVTNEKHRHAHESIFLTLQGQALPLIEGEEIELAEGGLAFVSRWPVHQTQNRSQDDQLRISIDKLSVLPQTIRQDSFGRTCSTPAMRLHEFCPPDAIDRARLGSRMS